MTFTKIHVILLLSLVLCASVGLNVSQFLRAFRAEVEAPLVDKVEAYEAADKINTAVAAARLADQRTIAKLQRELETKQAETVTVYRDRVRTLPAPACAPGVDRVDAWNAIAQEAP